MKELDSLQLKHASAIPLQSEMTRQLGVVLIQHYSITIDNSPTQRVMNSDGPVPTNYRAPKITGTIGLGEFSGQRITQFWVL
jgi:hypothetical protein